jgi:hypothetical protein
MLHFFLSLSFIPSQLVSKTKDNTELQKEICKHLGPWGPAKSTAAGGTLQPPQSETKLVTKNTENISPPHLEGQNTEQN